MVILPDYQGIGLGTKFLTEVAKIYELQGFDFMITTSAKNLAYSLKRKSDWLLRRAGRVSQNKSNLLAKTWRSVATYTFLYKSTKR